MKTKEKFCKKCGAEIVDAKVKICSACGEKIGKPIFKKWWFWVIVGVVVIAIVAGGDNASGDVDNTSSDAAKVTNTTTNNVDNETTTTNNKFSSLGDWKRGEYTDEFDQPTGEKYVSVESKGTFSNSATTDSRLTAILQIDNENIGIMLWEYNSYQVKGIFDYENYSISILDDNGTKHSFTGTLYDGGTRIYFKSNDRNAVLNLLNNNENLKFYLKSDKYTTSTYLFTISTNGFTSAYSSITQ